MARLAGGAGGTRRRPPTDESEEESVISRNSDLRKDSETRNGRTGSDTPEDGMYPQPEEREASFAHENTTVGSESRIASNGEGGPGVSPVDEVDSGALDASRLSRLLARSCPWR